MHAYVFLFVVYLFFTKACRTRWSRPSPVLEVRPSPRERGSEVIWYNSNDEDTYRYYVDELNHFLDPYVERNEKAQNCDLTLTPDKNKFCRFKVPRYAPCFAENSYGFSEHIGGPCILLKLNQFPKNWLPQIYNSTDVPGDMPDYLKNIVRRRVNQGTHQTVWVSCEGETPADRENIGPRAYSPDIGFPIGHLLNHHLDGYLSPFVIVHFEKPERGIIISVVCTMWARNIHRDAEYRQGTVHFELMVD